MATSATSGPTGDRQPRLPDSVPPLSSEAMTKVPPPAARRLRLFDNVTRTSNPLTKGVLIAAVYGRYLRFCRQHGPYESCHTTGVNPFGAMDGAMPGLRHLQPTGVGITAVPTGWGVSNEVDRAWWAGRHAQAGHSAVY
jgi:hypothetical protein